MIAILAILKQDIRDDKLQKISNIFKPFVSELLLNDYRVLMEKIFRNFFEYYSKSMNYVEGFNFFKQFINIGSQNLFYNHLGFFFFFSYQLKDYSYIKSFLNHNIFPTLYNSFKGSRDFSLFCFYKGLIHLSLREFMKAAFSFCQCVQNAVRSTLEVIDIFQVYSLERLILLTFIVDKEVNQIIHPLIKKFKSVTSESYLHILMKIYFDDKNVLSNLEELNQNILSEENHISGLIQIAIEEYTFKQIQNLLKCYKTIQISKLRTYLNIDTCKILTLLEKKFNEGRINIKYNEKDEIIEVIDYNSNINNNLSELQKLHVEMVSICEDLSRFESCKMKWMNEKKKLGKEKLMEYLDMEN